MNLTALLDISPVLFRDAIIFSNLIALTCVGITATYMTTKVPNFAQGAFVDLGIYVSVTVASLWNLSPYAGLPVAFLLGALSGVMMYQFAMRPQMKRRASVVLLMVTTLAVDILFVGILNIYADYLQTGLGVSSRNVNLRNRDFMMLSLPGIFIVSTLLLISSAVGLYLFLHRTRFGIALRATVEESDLAGSMGVNIEQVYRVAWVISGGLAGVVGALFPLWLLSSTNTGEQLILEMFTGSLLGGVYSIFGTFAGGFIAGFAETVISTLLGITGVAFKPIIPLIMMTLVLLFLPSGLGGIVLRRRRKK